MDYLEMKSKKFYLQTAIYCSVPDANSAFRIAQGVFDDIDVRG
jgi:3-oxoadipate enol-lactonase/4-carboxymuconolactone decarboxylase